MVADQYCIAIDYGVGLGKIGTELDRLALIRGIRLILAHLNISMITSSPKVSGTTPYIEIGHGIIALRLRGFCWESEDHTQVDIVNYHQSLAGYFFFTK